VRFWRIYWWISLGGLGVFVGATAFGTALGGSPFELGYEIEFWIALWIFIGALAVGVRLLGLLGSAFSRRALLRQRRP
jgi:hypothetical protein